MEIIVKNYDHYNRALGKYIGSKAQYEKEMKAQGMVSFEQGQRMAEEYKSKSRKEYKGLSKDAESIIRHATSVADNKGNVKCGDRMIDAMKKVGVNFDALKHIPKE